MLQTWSSIYAVLLAVCCAESVQVTCPFLCKNGALNTICLRVGCTSAEMCTELKMSEKFRKWLTRSHNSLRDSVAINEMVANMLALSYDLDLEYMAQCWVNACKLQKDKCRVTPAFPDRVGQNIAARKMIKSEGHIQNIVEKWFKNGTITTMLARTSHLGCGMAMTDVGNVLLVCNYGVPEGNMSKADYGYIHGYTSTRCAEGQRTHHEYVNLCTVSEVKAGIWRITTSYLLLLVCVFVFV